MRLFTVFLCRNSFPLLLSVTCAVALMIPGLVDAQYFDSDPTDPYPWMDPWDQDRYEERQRRALQDELDRYTPDPQVDFWQRENEMRERSIEACNYIDRNPAAQAACLDRIR